MNKQRINEILVVLLIATCALIFISLISFDPQDLSLYSSKPNISPRNFAGTSGAYISGFLIFLFGKASYIMPVLIFIGALGSLKGRAAQKLYFKLLGGFIMIFSTSSLFSMLDPGSLSEKFIKGGLVGLGFSKFLTKYFSLAGSYIILSTLFVLSLILATGFLLFPFLRVASKNTSSLFRFLKEVKLPFKKSDNVIRPREYSLPSSSPPEIITKPRIKPAKAGRFEKSEELTKAERKPVSLREDKTVRPDYKIPSLDLLDSPPPISERQISDDLELNSKILEETLADFDLEVKVVKIEQGPVITRYELEPAPGIRVSHISSLGDDIALAMKATSVRVIAPIPGKGTVGIEVPNSEKSLVYLREILESGEFKTNESKLAIALGKDIAGSPVIADLGDMPHLLIAGTTGSGKTVCVNTIIASLLFRYSPEELKFIMIDPKMVELASFNGLPHLLCPVVTDFKKVSGALNWVVEQMEARYQLFAEVGSRNIDMYNEQIEETMSKLPYIIIIIDELADLMSIAQNDIENAITRLAQLSRAVGIHIILATQRPSVDVITGVIKANFPARISFKVASKVDSRTVLDINGADKLLGKGDMLFIEPNTSGVLRAQGSLVSNNEIARLVEFIKAQRDEEYNDEILVDRKKMGFKQFDKDEVYDEAVRLVLQTKQASVSMLQRRLGLGYTRAARIIDMMEDNGVVGPYAGSKPRQILIEGLETAGKETDEQKD